MRRLAAYLPLIIVALVGLVMFSALLAGYNPQCHCEGVCSCPAEGGPAFPLLTLAVSGTAVVLAGATYLVRRNTRASLRG
jgi:hypothetical protein